MRKNQTILQIGRLVSTTNMEMAARLGELVHRSEIVGDRENATARIVEGGNQVYMINGDLYELEAAEPTLDTFPLMYETV